MMYPIEFEMLSATDMAAIKVAIEICNNTKLKREILCIHADIKNESHLYDLKRKWNKTIRQHTKIILEGFRLPVELQDKISGIVPTIGMRMLTWARYHEYNFGFSREYSINHLNSSFFTQEGKINNKNSAEKLLNDPNLRILQKYKIACFYCFTDRIPNLFKQSSREENFSPCVYPPGLVKFWTYYLMGYVHEILGTKTLREYRLEVAVASGSKAAVEYCLEKQKNDVVNAAVEALRNMANINYNRKELWVLNAYYMDILCFLLSKMNRDDQVELLKKDIEDDDHKALYYKDPRHSRVLEFFLDFPYQDYFMKMVELMWEFLPESNFAFLLQKLCRKIESTVNIKYIEGKTYDYRWIFKEFWYQSPDRYKKFVLSNQTVAFKNRFLTVGLGVVVLFNLLILKNFTEKDRKNVELILVSATAEEKEKIFSSEEWKDIWIRLMEREQWKLLDRFALNCFSSKKEADQFKRDFIFTDEVKCICIDFVKNDKWDAIATFLNWGSLTEEEIRQLKRKMIYSEYGKRACWDLVMYKENGVEVAKKIFKWCFASEEREEEEFKREFIFSQGLVKICTFLVPNYKLERFDKFLSLCLHSQEKIKEFKKKVACKVGGDICESLISNNLEKFIYDEHGQKIKGCQWEEVEKFLTWCFSSEEEITKFKKKLLKMSGVQIHINLLNKNQWEEAETFFAWLGLSVKKIKKLKKDTLFYDEEASEMFRELMLSKEGDTRFVDYGSKQEAIELLLRWYLTDKETTLEFKDEFKSQYNGAISEEHKAMLENFDLLIEQRLKDLDTIKKEIKRKSEIFSVNKKLCK